jgi:alkylation response protein AidB-like acyl-CoA dehydrogenase
VPEYRTIAGMDVESGEAPGQRINTNPMYCAISWANFTAAMAAPALGVARGFLQAYLDRLKSKSSNVDDGLTINMSRYAQATAMVDSVHALTLQNAMQYARTPALEVSQQVRARCRRDQAFTAQTARKAINFLYEEGGGTGLFDSSDLQRFWRDVNAAAAHRGLTADWIYAGWAKTLLELKADPGFLF